MLALIAYLLRKLRRLHLRLDDLESDNVSSGPATIIPLCAVADGETAFPERRASRIVDARRLGDNWRRRLSVNGRHGDCRWPWMHKCCACRACLRWTGPSRDEGRAVEFTAAHTRSALPWATPSPAKSSGRFRLAPHLDSELKLHG